MEKETAYLEIFNPLLFCSEWLLTMAIFFCFRSFERTTPILFEKTITKPGQSADFMEEKRAVFEKASLSCLPSVIRMGLGITQGHLQEHVSGFRDKLVGLPGRLPSIYSCYHYFAYEVSTIFVTINN